MDKKQIDEAVFEAFAAVMAEPRPTMHEPTRMEAQVCVDLLEKDVASALAAIGVEVPE